MSRCDSLRLWTPSPLSESPVNVRGNPIRVPHPLIPPSFVPIPSCAPPQIKKGPDLPGLLERETGLEPATSTLARWHSTTELLPRNRAYLTGARSGVKGERLKP